MYISARSHNIIRFLTKNVNHDLYGARLHVYLHTVFYFSEEIKSVYTNTDAICHSAPFINFCRWESKFLYD